MNWRNKNKNKKEDDEHDAAVCLVVELTSDRICAAATVDVFVVAAI
jgi:hypothetical protein